MLNSFLEFIDPDVKRDWASFYPKNDKAIAKFMCHSKSFPWYKNPIDHLVNVKDIRHFIPEKYRKLKFGELLEIAPYKLKKHLLANKSFIIKAYDREQKYDEVIKLLDNCPHGVTSVCKKHMSFELWGGSRLPQKESFIDSLSLIDRAHYLLGARPHRLITSIFEEESKRGERTLQDVTSVKHASSVDYDDLDMFFLELYPYCSEIQSEEKRIKGLLHEEDIEEQFQKEIIENERRIIFYKDYLENQNHHKDSAIDQKEYCILHKNGLDQFISTKIKEEVDAIANKWKHGYEWYVKANTDTNNGEKLKDGNFLFGCFKHKSLIKEKDETIKRYHELLSLYPDGIEEYKKAANNATNKPSNATPSYEEIVKLGDVKLKEYQTNAQMIKFLKTCLSSQADLSKYCREKREQFLPTWGYYKYNIPIESVTYDGKETKENFVVWQMFYQGFCQDTTLDYTNNQSYSNNANKLSDFKGRTRTFVNAFYDKIMALMKDLKNKYGEEFVVLFGTSGINNYIPFNAFHFKYLMELLTNNGIEFKQITDEPIAETRNVKYAIIELITDNAHLKDVCTHVLDIQVKNSEAKEISSSRNIIYISLYKGLDSDEMKTIIKSTNEKIAKQKAEEEKKRKEEEIKRREEEAKRLKEELERKAKEEQKQREYNDSLAHLTSSVSLWDCLPNGIRYTFLYNYYPTTCPFEADEEEWNVRNLIWAFKNNPNKKVNRCSHAQALMKVTPNVARVLQYYFGNNLRKLVFVPITASTRENNELRYEKFSTMICESTGMTNGYPYIHIVKDAVPKHLGGDGNPTLQFDESSFKGKFVLLFDDVATTGSSIYKYKILIEQLGAKVIGAFTIGRTKHERGTTPPNISNGLIQRLTIL